MSHRRKDNDRRGFLKKAIATSLLSTPLTSLASVEGMQGKSLNRNEDGYKSRLKSGGKTSGSSETANRIAFPIGGIGAGMFCMEGTGAISHMSVRNRPEIFHEPCTFAAIKIKGADKTAKVLEGPVPDWKIFGQHGSGNGASGSSFGLSRFAKSEFSSEFPFAEVRLYDNAIPLEIKITGWSPFIPTDEDNSSLPVGAFEYHFKNPNDTAQDAIFSWNSMNFMNISGAASSGRKTYGKGDSIDSFQRGFILSQKSEKDAIWKEGYFVAFTPEEDTQVDYSWFRGGWFDPLTMAWKKIENGDVSGGVDTIANGAPGASLYVSFKLAPGEEKTIKLLFAWYVPNSDLRTNTDISDDGCLPGSSCADSPTYRPWYAQRFATISEVASYWKENYSDLRKKTTAFSRAFYDTTLPAEVVEAVAANLTIIKSPTVLRQTDGNLWAWEGSRDDVGCCRGSCTHVWNYAQAIPHLFPRLERSLRETEFRISQDENGHQTFRTPLPIRRPDHNFHAAADGQLGGIMKVFREWRISGDTKWMSGMFPYVKSSLDYCVECWDPKGKGILEEPHHNTYDIEFWGPDGMCTSIYLGALTAFVEMCKALKEPYKKYKRLLDLGAKYMEDQLFNGEYFVQKIVWTGLRAKDPVAEAKNAFTTNYSEEALLLLEKEGPKYQYGDGCLSDGVLGMWLASCCNLTEVIDKSKIISHLKSVHKYNLKKDLSDYSNPQRPTFAWGKEAGLLLCTWPMGHEPSLPFIYSNEVWTGIEYQVASHLMMNNLVSEGLEIVRSTRQRYDGTLRNPFNEYECGHWYARAMSSYGLLQGLTGIRYDAVEKELYIDSKVGKNFKSFFSSATGFGTIGLTDGKPFVKMVHGQLDVRKFIVSGKVFKI